MEKAVARYSLHFELMYPYPMKNKVGLLIINLNLTYFLSSYRQQSVYDLRTKYVNIAYLKRNE